MCYTENCEHFVNSVSLQAHLYSSGTLFIPWDAKNELIK
jgi:hypothetical protein